MGNINDILLVAKNKGYHVDKDGNVFSVRKKLALRKAQERYHFTIRYYGQRVTIAVHKFVAYLKFGNKIFIKGIVVRHLNGDSLNNSWKNIGIGTHSDNMMDIPKKIRVEKAIKASTKIRKFSDEEIQQIWDDKNSGMSFKKICEKYNTCKSTLSYFFNKAYYSGAKKIDINIE